MLLLAVRLTCRRTRLNRLQKTRGQHVQQTRPPAACCCTLSPTLIVLAPPRISTAGGNSRGQEAGLAGWQGLPVGAGGAQPPPPRPASAPAVGGLPSTRAPSSNSPRAYPALNSGSQTFSSSWLCPAASRTLITR